MSIEPTFTSQSLNLIKVIRGEAGTYKGYLVIRDVDEMSKPTSYGRKLTISGPFKSSMDVKREGDKLYERFLKGEITSQPYAAKIKLRGYRIIGKARFDADQEGWEPTLELKKLEEPNNGKIQIVMGRNTAFARNLFSTEERGARFALDAGKAMVIDRTGLEI